MKNNLQGLRKQIQQVDGKILKLLAERFEFAKQVGQIKHKLQIKTSDPKREKDLLNFYRKQCVYLNLDYKIAKKVFMAILRHSKRIQNNEKP